MTLFRIGSLIKARKLLQNSNHIGCAVRNATSSKYGTVLPEPQKVSFGILKIILTVVPGLLIGAAISKNIANFLEENDLFVPSDDDDDDD